MTKKIETPSVKQVKDCLKQREEMAKRDPHFFYVPQKEFLDNWFRDVFPKNNNLKEVLTKAYMLDSLYLTQSKTKYLDKFAENITQMKDFDQRLKDGDRKLVNEISYVEINEQDHKTIYSFTTKFCSFHYPEKYPIYDSNVKETLMYFKNEICKFKGDDLKDYPKFNDVLFNFKERFGLEEFNWIEIDRYLFLMGRKLKEQGAMCKCSA